MIIDFIYHLITKKEKNNSDYHKIKVTSNGGFYMESEDIFNDKEKSLALLNNLDNLIKSYNTYMKNKSATSNKKSLENSL